MAGSLNKVLLIGRLGKDPELREFPSGGKVCNFSLATSDTWKDSNTGERQERTSWHNIAIYNNRLAEIAEQYLKKGRTVIAIAHRLSTIRNAEIIYVLEEGRIVESGNHESLLDIKGVYSKLWSVQTGEKIS